METSKPPEDVKAGTLRLAPSDPLPLEDEAWDYLVPPLSRHFGDKDADQANVEFQGIELRVGTRPYALNLKHLYKRGHPESRPFQSEAYAAHEVWLVVHAVSVAKFRGSATLESIAYDARYANKRVHNIDYAQVSRRDRGDSCRVWLSAEGRFLTEERLDPTGTLIRLPGRVTLSLSDEDGIVGLLTFPASAHEISAEGVASTESHWRLSAGPEALLGEHLLIQTMLVPLVTRSLSLDCRAQILLRPTFWPILARRQTVWCDSRCEELTAPEIVVNDDVDRAPHARGTQVFISHTTADRDLAQALVDVLDAAIAFPPKAIRCTSIVRHSLEGGDPVGQVLRDDLRECAIVLCLVTNASLASSYVLMELGAAWGLGKTAIPLVVPGISADDLPDLLRHVHALRLEDGADVLSRLIDQVAQLTKTRKRADTEGLERKVRAFTATLSPRND